MSTAVLKNATMGLRTATQMLAQSTARSECAAMNWCMKGTKSATMGLCSTASQVRACLHARTTPPRPPPRLHPHQLVHPPRRHLRLFTPRQQVLAAHRARARLRLRPQPRRPLRPRPRHPLLLTRISAATTLSTRTAVRSVMTVLVLT